MAGQKFGPHKDTLEAVKAAYVDILTDEHLDKPMNAPPVSFVFKKNIKIKPHKVFKPIRMPKYLQASAAEYVAELKGKEIVEDVPVHCG